MGQLEPEASEEREDAPSWAWVSWVLVAACVGPVLLLAEVARRVLTGGYDAEFFGGFADSEDLSTIAEMVDRLEISTGQRFSVLWVQADLPWPLLGPALAALVLGGVVLAGRPGWLVPGLWGRRVAAVGAWLAAAQSLVAAVGLLQVVAGNGVGSRGSLQLSWYGAPEGFPEVAGALAVLVPLAVVTAVAGVVVWPGAALQPAPGPPAADDEAQEVPPEEVAAGPQAAPHGTQTSSPTPQDAPASPQFPGVPDTDRNLYRRPS